MLVVIHGTPLLVREVLAAEERQQSLQDYVLYLKEVTEGVQYVAPQVSAGYTVLSQLSAEYHVTPDQVTLKQLITSVNTAPYPELYAMQLSCSKYYQDGTLGILMRCVIYLAITSPQQIKILKA